MRFRSSSFGVKRRFWDARRKLSWPRIGRYSCSRDGCVVISISACKEYYYQLASYWCLYSSNWVNHFSHDWKYPRLAIAITIGPDTEIHFLSAWIVFIDSCKRKWLILRYVRYTSECWGYAGWVQLVIIPDHFADNTIVFLLWFLPDSSPSYLKIDLPRAWGFTIIPATYDPSILLRLLLVMSNRARYVMVTAITAAVVGQIKEIIRF